MNNLSVEKISKTYNETALFSDLTFGIGQGQKVALIGKNGSGKSTLLNIIAGTEAPDSGKVVLRKGINIKFLPQNPEFNPQQTVKEYIFEQENDVLKTISLYEQYINGELTDPEGNLFERLSAQLDALEAWDYETSAKQILGKLGIHNLRQKIGELSGGEKKRIALANTLIEKPDFLILDEPTNHLDIEVIEWLEQYLSTQKMSLLLVTHDRFFLEKVTSEIFELEDAQIYTYKGNYSYFISRKTERQRQKAADIARARNLLVKELDWLNRMPKARGSKAKYRINAVEGLEKTAAQKVVEEQMEIKVLSKRQGKKILELHGITQKFNGVTLIDSFTYTFKKNDRIGVIGKNGAGKTTLMNIITGQLKPERGTVITGETTVFGYYRQEKLLFRPGQKVIDVVRDITEVIKLSDGSTLSPSRFLQQFLFPPAMHQIAVEKLSGGEKRRLQLLRVLLSQPNFLILDEPTNDLDIYVLNVLEQYLMNFPGTLIIVSHDRYFLDKLADHLFVFEGSGRITDFPGNYTRYKNHIHDIEKENKGSEKRPRGKQKEKIAAGKRKRLGYKEKKELETLEIEIEKLELEKEELLLKLNGGSDDHRQLTEWSEKFEVISKEIDDKTLRWMELSERL